MSPHAHADIYLSWHKCAPTHICIYIYSNTGTHHTNTHRKLCPSPYLEQAEWTLSIKYLPQLDFGDRDGTFCLGASAVSCRSGLPTELALLLIPAETKGGSVGSLYINTVLNSKLWALMRNFVLPHPSLTPLFISSPHFWYIQFISGCWTATQPEK